METKLWPAEWEQKWWEQFQAWFSQLNVLIPWLAVLKKKKKKEKKEKGDDLQSDLGCLVLKNGQTTRQKEPESLMMEKPEQRPLTKRPWCWERVRVGGEGCDTGWDGWIASPTQQTWVWTNWEMVKDREACSPWGRKEPDTIATEQQQNYLGTLLRERRNKLLTCLRYSNLGFSVTCSWI